MNAYETTVKNQLEASQAEPGQELREMILQNAADGTASPLPVRRKPKLRAVLVAAAFLVLSVTTAAAVMLPGYQKTLDVARQLSIHIYEKGMLPHKLPHNNFISVVNIDGILQNVNSKNIRLDSLETAQEVLGMPLLVPACLERDEVPVMIHDISSMAEGNSYITIDVLYEDAYWDAGRGIVRNNPDANNGYFFLHQTYVGDSQVIFDSVGEYTEMEVNGYKAAWVHNRQDQFGSNYDNGALYWIQEGYFIQLGPAGLDFDYVMRIAESMRPMQG